MQTSEKNHSYQTTLLIILLIMFLNTIGSHLGDVNQVRMLDHHHHLLSEHLSDKTRNLLLGVLMGAGGFIHFFITPILVSFSDRFGRKPLLLFSFSSVLISAIFSIVGLKLHSFAIVFFGSLLSFSGIVKCLSETVTVDISSGRLRKLYLGFTAVARMVAAPFAVILGAYLASSKNVSWFTLRTPYYFSLILIGINLLVILFLFKEPKHSYNQKTVKPSINIFRIWFDMFKKNPEVIKPLIAFSIFEFSYALFCHDIAFFWHGFLHTSISSMAHYFAFNSALNGFTLLVFLPIWLKKIPEKYQLSIPIILMSVSFVLISIFYMPLGRWILIIPAAVFATIAYTQLLASVPSSVTEDKHGAAMGVVHSMTALVWSTSAFIAVPLNDLSPHLPLFVTCAIGLLSYAFVRKNKKVTENIGVSVAT